MKNLKVKMQESRVLITDVCSKFVHKRISQVETADSHENIYDNLPRKTATLRLKAVVSITK